jgi:hypothetical protein
LLHVDLRKAVPPLHLPARPNVSTERPLSGRIDAAQNGTTGAPTQI